MSTVSDYLKTKGVVTQPQAQSTPNAAPVQQTDDGLSSVQRYMGTKTIPPAATPSFQQSPKAGALTSLSNTSKSFLGGVGNAVVGAAKGLGHTVATTGEFGERGLATLFGRKPVGHGGTEQALQSFGVRNAFTPTNTAQKIGFGTEQVGEFFVPGSQVSKGIGIADKALEGLNLAQKGANLAKDFGLGERAVQTASKLAPEIGKFGARTIGEGLSGGAITTAQTGDIKEGVKGGLLTGALVPSLNVAAEKILPGLAKKIQTSSMRLTPVQKRNLGGKVSEVANWLTKNKIVGTPERRISKLDDIYESTEDRLQQFLTKDAAGRTVNKRGLLTDMEGIKDAYKYDRDYNAINRQIEDAKSVVQTQFPDQIPVDVLNQFKRSVYNGAYNRAGEKVLDTVEHDIGEKVYDKLLSAVQDLKISGKGLKEFNKEYSTIILARKLLKTAASRNQAGFLSKLISTLVGHTIGAIGGPMGSAVGAAVAPHAVETFSGGLPRSAASAVLGNLSRFKIGDVAKPIPALFRKE